MISANVSTTVATYWQQKATELEQQRNELLAALKGMVYCPDYRNVSTRERRIATNLIAKIEGRAQ